MPLQSDKFRLLRRIPDIRFETESRGYSKDQVDRVLANLAPLADDIEKLQARLAESESRAASAEARLVEARSPSGDGADAMPATSADFDETLRNTLVSAQRQADLLRRDAQEEAERLRTEAEFQSNALLADARDQSAEMTTEAVAYRERLMAEAASERARLLEEATEEARNHVKSVETELVDAHEQERANLIAQIIDLNEKHRLLQGDVERFEAHLASRCDKVRAAMAEIAQVLDDPTSLRPEDGIEPADLEPFEPDDYPPIAVEVVALNDLSEESAKATADLAPAKDPIDAADLDELDLTDEHIELDREPMDLTEEHPAPVEAEEVSSFDDYSYDDPQLGVQTQVVPPPPIVESQTAPAPEADMSQELTLEPPSDDAPTWPATEDGPDDEAIDSFFREEDDDRDRGGGWFGRRR